MQPLLLLLRWARVQMLRACMRRCQLALQECMLQSMLYLPMQRPVHLRGSGAACMHDLAHEQQPFGSRI